MDVQDNLGVQAPLEQTSTAGSFTQEQLNKIVAREKAAAAERARREAEERYAQEVSALKADKQQNPRSMEVDSDAIANDVLAKIQKEQDRLKKEFEERQLQEHMGTVANNYLQKIEESKNNYPDFSEVTDSFNPREFPQLTYILSEIPGAGDVVYELANNPTKLAALHTLSLTSYNLAKKELTKLAKSISDNRAAKQEADAYNIPDPIDSISPSRSASKNTDNMSIKDYRNQSWLRG